MDELEVIAIIDQRIDRLHDRLEADATEPSERDMLTGIVQELYELKHDLLKHFDADQTTFNLEDDGF